MDINASKFINQTSSLEMSMETQIFQDQIPFTSYFPAGFSLQTHQILSSSSSTSIPISALLGDHISIGNDHMEEEEEPEEELGAMKEMMYKIAAMQPVDIDPATIRKPKRRNVRISDDPQSVAARHRRERISEKIRILQRLVPGGTKMDTASMLDEAILYVKFLKRQIRLLQSNQNPPCIGGWRPLASTTSSPLESPAAAAAGPGKALLSNGGEPGAMCFNHEVLSD